MDQAMKDLIAAAERGREVLRAVAVERRKLGPIATQAQTAAVQLTTAIDALAKATPAYGQQAGATASTPTTGEKE